MKAVTLSDSGVEIVDIEVPRPQSNQILVKVRACGLNRLDLLQTQRRAQNRVVGDAKVLGVEFAGEVVEVGSDAKGINIGDRVMCLGAAGWAEYALVDWRRNLPIPSAKISYEHGAALLTATLTMHNAVVSSGRFVAGETVLVQGASSGVGLMGMQIARTKGARLVIGTSTNPERRKRLAEFGADLALDSRDDGWVDQILAATNGRGVDLTVDLVSGYVANQNLAATAVDGRILNVGRLGGFTGGFDFDLHARRRIHHIGVTTFANRTMEQIVEVVRLTRADLWDAVAAGKLVMPIDKIFALKDASAALDRMAANEHFGKIVLSLDG